MNDDDEGNENPDAIDLAAMDDFARIIRQVDDDFLSREFAIYWAQEEARRRHAPKDPRSAT